MDQPPAQNETYLEQDFDAQVKFFEQIGGKKKRPPVDATTLVVPVVSVFAVISALLLGVFWIQGAIASSYTKMEAGLQQVQDEVRSVREKLIHLETTRLTNTDGLAIWQGIAAARENIARIETRQAVMIEALLSLEERLRSK